MTEAFVKFLENLSHNDKLHVAKSSPQVLRAGEDPKVVIMLVVMAPDGSAKPNADTACFVLGAEGEGESLAPVAPTPENHVYDPDCACAACNPETFNIG